MDNIMVELHSFISLQDLPTSSLGLDETFLANIEVYVNQNLA